MARETPNVKQKTYRIILLYSRQGSENKALKDNIAQQGLEVQAKNKNTRWTIQRNVV